MRRLLRWAFNFAAAVSAVVFVGVCVLWCRSPVDLVRTNLAGHWVSAGVSQGRLNGAWADVEPKIGDRFGPTHERGFAGARWRRVDGISRRNRWVTAEIPNALVLAVAAGVLTLRWVGWATSRPRRGLCPSCGYDLRATPGRCPECGAVPMQPKAAA